MTVATQEVAAGAGVVSSTPDAKLTFSKPGKGTDEGVAASVYVSFHCAERVGLSRRQGVIGS